MGGRARSQSSHKRVLAAPDGRAGPEQAAAIVAQLGELWPKARCELRHDNPFQLLVATVLSAQSTDRRVNQVTPEVFARYPDPAALAEAEPDELEALIYSTGFFRMKAKHLIAMARDIVARRGGEVPRTMRALTALPGVARKTANVVLGVAFGVSSGIVVDTHVRRVSRRLGLTDATAAEAIERDLMGQIKRSKWVEVSHQMIWHGRRVCHARQPACDACGLAPLCPSATVGDGET